jgi:hypothetical protein
MLECSELRPWGIHDTVHNDAACGRCGWVAPGPIGDAIADAEFEAREAMALASALSGLLANDSAGDVPLAA